MYKIFKKVKSLKKIPFLLLLLLLTACTQQEVDEEQNAFSDMTESGSGVSTAENDPDRQQDITRQDTTLQGAAADAVNQDILTASAGTTVTQTVETSAGGVISIDAQVDVDGISRVSRYRYIPLQFTEESRKTVLEKMFPAESWDVNEAAAYNEQKNSWEFETPRKENWIYQISDSQVPGEQIMNIERVDIVSDHMKASKISPIRILNEEDVMLFIEVMENTPGEIEQIGRNNINSVTDANYLCSYIHLCGEYSEHPYAKAVFKQVVDGMPVTVWHNFSTATSKGSLFPIKVWGTLYSIEDIGLDKPILTPDEAAAAIQEQIDSIQMEETQMTITKISLEYLSVISSEGTPEVVPIWRFWPGNDETERLMLCEQIFAVNAVSGELIWENREAFAE
ncbi:MAG: hypothetical protein NC517_01620 [Firmicutes bacterium]|nr:hypothetical protein [Bacillota bacterium]